MNILGSSIAILVFIGVALGLALAALIARRRELQHSAKVAEERTKARERGTSRARLQYPNIDLARCVGCGSCVAACPEEGVLDLIHGQAAVVHGARCVGHGRCAAECPVGAIALTFADLHERTDLPVVDSNLESVGNPGVFLAGEVTGHALVRTAISHGVAVAGEVARRIQQNPSAANGETLDLCIVGAGPAGVACALEAQSRGLRFRVLEQEALGGTVSKYPRRKLVMTQPVTLPLHGLLANSTYTKEELMDLWQSIATKYALPISTGEEFEGVERLADGNLLVKTKKGTTRARFVCLALGRRGTPNKLGVDGESLPKVSYSLLDANSYTGRHLLVVGGGDSAVEAALALAEQAGNTVTLSYRRKEFTRLRARNEARLLEARQSGHLHILMESEVVRILPDRVELVTGSESSRAVTFLENDEIFILAGGTAPLEKLKNSGVSFDPALRAKSAPIAARTEGLLPGVSAAFVLFVLAVGWVLYHWEYYQLSPSSRADSPLHSLLRSSGTAGLTFGIGSVVFIFANLAYLVRRARWFSLTFGSLQAWMTSHVATGIFALLLAVLHGSFAPRSTVGGHGLLAMAVILLTGAIGRYFYAYVPRASNGRELALEEIRANLASLSTEWDERFPGFGERVQVQIQTLVESGRWHGNFFRRALSLVVSHGKLRRAVAQLTEEGRREGIPAAQLSELMDLARRAHRAAFMAAHYEDLRTLLATWRYLHRWVALLLVLMVALHIYTALRFGGISWPGGGN